MATVARIKVDPDVLETQAGAAESARDTLLERLDALNALVEATRGYWEGEAADMYCADFAKARENVVTGMNRCTSSIDDLRVVAGVYRRTETTLTSYASDMLPESSL